MSITELIKHVGEEHIQCQYLDSSFDSAKVVKGVGLITFVTEQSKVMERLGVGQRHRCMILWMPDERFPTPAEIRRADAAKARATKADAAKEAQPTGPYADAYGVGLPPDTQANQPTKPNQNETQT